MLINLQDGQHNADADENADIVLAANFLNDDRTKIPSRSTGLRARAPTHLERVVPTNGPSSAYNISTVKVACADN